MNNATTHLIYGEKFKYYSTIYGKGSKKYAAAKRRGEDIMVWTVGEWDEKMKEDGRVVTEEWLQVSFSFFSLFFPFFFFFFLTNDFS